MERYPHFRLAIFDRFRVLGIAAMEAVMSAAAGFTVDNAGEAPLRTEAQRQLEFDQAVADFVVPDHLPDDM